MPHFEQDFIEFFKELAGNNNREWFHAHKPRYEEQVKEPFHAFVAEMIRRIEKEDPRIKTDVRNSVFRFYRDIRFSADKSPYKLHVAAAISRRGRRHTMGEPGYYFHFSPEAVMVCGGLYRPDKQTLAKIRRHLVGHPHELPGILEDRGFTSKWGELQGEKNKILPKEFKEAARATPLLFNKGFYGLAELPAETVLRRDLAALLMRYFRSVRPLNEFLWKALKSPPAL